MFPKHNSKSILWILAFLFSTLTIFGQEEKKEDTENSKFIAPPKGESQQARFKPGSFSVGFDMMILDINAHLSYYFTSSTAIGCELIVNPGLISLSYKGFTGDYYTSGLNKNFDNLGFAIFLRQELKEAFHFDIGANINGMTSIAQSGNNLGEGTFIGGYTKLFMPIYPNPIKEKNGKIRKRANLGIKAAYGIVTDSGITEKCIALSFFVRISPFYLEKAQ